MTEITIYLLYAIRLTLYHKTIVITLMFFCIKVDRQIYYHYSNL